MLTLPAQLAKVAAELFNRRWWFLTASFFGLAIVIGMLTIGSPQLMPIAGALAGPLIFVPWTFLCLCVWFHPQKGNLQPSSRLVGQLPPVLQSVVRWYGGIMLVIFLIFGAVIWPAFAIFSFAT